MRHPDYRPRKQGGRIWQVWGAALLWIGMLGLSPTAGYAAHAITQYGDPPRYPAGFSHFDYVNADAPQGGTLYLPNPDRRTSFDKFNPFTLKGIAAPGIGPLMFETLATGSADEVGSAYGLLADDIVVAPDKLSVTFHLNPKARFSNGDAVLAEDVKYSFDMLMSQLASPSYRTIFVDVAQAVVVSERVIRFEFRRRNSELPLIVCGLPVFSKKWGQKADGTRTAFDQLSFELPIASGPYLIEKFEAGRSITFRRNPAYWGKALNVRRGSFNFERVVYRLYKDDTARLEAFKAGEFDAQVEYRAKNWAKSYQGPKFRRGELIAREFSHRNGAGMQGFVMNMRRPIFQDLRVRQALNLALDFDWMNRQLFYQQYQRIDSYFTNSELAASSGPNQAPDEQERRLLTPLIGQPDMPPEAALFGALPKPPTTAAPASLRDNLRLARGLLEQAGWRYADGALRNAQGQPFVFEILDDGGAMSRIVSAYVRNLEKLGIQVNQRVTDYALYQKRLEDFDFDMISMRYPDSQSPGNELLDRFGSRAAEQKGSDNVIGVRSPVVDMLVDAVIKAQTRAELVTASRALDRVLMLNTYVVPHWYSATHRIAYRRSMGFPQTLPLYYTAESWILSTWWRQPDGVQQPVTPPTSHSQ